ncbi:MAG: response regulator [Pseudomonadota bacterium]
MPFEPRILIIDDEPQMCESLRVFLEGYGYEVRTASDGKKGIECLADDLFSLVITDMVMPDTDGLAIMDYIKANCPDTLVIVMTGHASVQSAIDALRKGAYDYLEKPFEPDKLNAIVQRAMGRARLQLQLKESEDALRRSEEKYREVVESSLVGIYIRQGDTIKFVNNTFAKMFGYTREELLHTDFWKLVHPDDIEMVRERGMKRLEGEPAPSQYESRGIKKKGETIWVNRRNIRIEHEGQPAILGNIVDITERKQMEEQLLQSEKLRAMGEMASGIAHDFNNILAAILGNTHLLLTTVQEPETLKRLKNIEIASYDASHTVKRLQSFTRVRKDDSDFERIDTLKLIDDVIAITKPKWKDQRQEKGINVDLVSDIKEVPPVAGHPSEIREVLTNLFFNALDAMPYGGTLTIGTRHICEWTDSDPEKEGIVEITVSDTGCGMSPEIRKRIFDPFFTTKDVNSSGLGLSVSYGIITRHGGEILVESKQGKGTTFIIRLPVALDARERVEKKFETAKCMKRARILVIEDDIMVSDVLEEMLSSVGHDVITAPNGREGIERFKNSRFDMVFTDLGMPEMSGWDVARFIKDTAPNMPIAMITGWGAEFDQKQLRDAGIDLVVAKPFSIDHIVHLVDKATELKEAAAESNTPLAYYSTGLV